MFHCAHGRLVVLLQGPVALNGARVGLNCLPEKVSVGLLRRVSNSRNYTNNPGSTLKIGSVTKQVAGAFSIVLCRFHYLRAGSALKR